MTSDVLTSIGKARLVAAGAAAMAVVALAMPAACAQSVPPNQTYEISGTPSVVRPGGTIAFTGTCWVDRYFGATTHVNVRGYLKPPAPEVPYDFWFADVAVDPADGSFSGRITVPTEAPEGEYALTSQCITQDQVPGNGRDEFTVSGEPLPTTTVATTTSTTPVTSTTVGGIGTGGTAPPAVPQVGTARFTG